MPMKFLFGLGNPGEMYEQSRHNVGMMVASALAQKRNPTQLPLQKKTLFSQIWKDNDLCIAWPQTFMNDSGRAVHAVVAFFDKSLLTQTSLPEVIVCHDDLDIPVGSYKIQFGVGPKVHNGLASVDAVLHTDQYWHVRIGVDGRAGERTIPSHEYVLQAFSPTERAAVQTVITQVVEDMTSRFFL